MRGTCTSCDAVTFIQNKKHGLCGECVYKKNHGGKSRQEVYKERSDKKAFDHISNAMKVGTTYKSEIKSGDEVVNEFNKNVRNWLGDEEGKKNELNQNIAEQKAIEEEGLNRFLIGNNTSIVTIDSPILNKFKKRVGIKRSKPKQVSKKQAEINHFYKLACIDMDYTTEPVCTGCLRYQGGEIKLSHSHIISREDCKRIGREDLIYARENLTYHCMTFGNNKGCHRKWENSKQRTSLDDYQKNIEYIKSISKELYLKYSK